MRTRPETVHAEPLFPHPATVEYSAARHVNAMPHPGLCTLSFSLSMLTDRRSSNLDFARPLGLRRLPLSERSRRTASR